MIIRFRMGYRFLSSLQGVVASCVLTLLLCAVDSSAALRRSLIVPCPQYPVSYTNFQFSRGIPEGCAQSECNYFVGINPSTSDKNLLEITLEGNARGWVAVGFSKTPSMYSADVVGCSRHSSGLVTVIDTWNSDHFKYNIMKERQDDICHYHAGYDFGRIACTFSRTIKGSDLKYDLDLNDDFYLLFGHGQTPRDSFAEGFTYHSTSTPVISEAMMNPVTGTIITATVPTAGTPLTGHKNSTTSTSAPTSAIVVVTQTVTAAVVDEAGQPGNNTTTACPSSPTRGTYHRLTHRIPSGCDPAQCDYFLGISTNPYDNDLLDFTLEGTAGGWIAVGFSKTPNMFEADVIGCNVYGDGRVVTIDTWNPLSPRWNVLDNDQSDICHYDAEIKDRGRLRCRFSRSIKGLSIEHDLDLNDDYYLLFGKGQNRQMSENGGFTYHSNRVPSISRIMINPVQDSDLGVELSLVAYNLKICPLTVSNSSTYRISQGFPRGCQQSECEYFVGINTNPVDDQFLDFTLEGHAEGWVAIGFSESPNMANSDVLGCIRYGNGMTWVIDAWNPTSDRANILDETQVDICLHSIEYSDGRLQCKFSRSVLGDTPDTDVNLDGQYYLLFGAGNRLQNNTVNGGFTHHDVIPHVSRELINPVNGSSDELVVTQEFSKPVVRALMKTHGILMIIAWPILSGTAIYFSAFMKPVLSKKGQWFYVHEGIMLASVILTATSIAIIFIAHVGRRVSGLVDLSVSLSLTHFVIGIIVAGGQIFNMLVALFRCKPSSRFRWIYNILHGKFTGYITALLSLANVAVGIYLFIPGPSPAFGLFLVVAIIGVLMYEVLHLFYNVLPRLLKLCRKKGEQEQSLLSINEKYAEANDDKTSPLGELKAVLSYSYRHHFGTLALVLTVIVPINITVCIFIAIA